VNESKAERVAANGRPLGRGGVTRDKGSSPSTRVGCSRTGPGLDPCLRFGCGGDGTTGHRGPAEAGHSGFATGEAETVRVRAGARDEQPVSILIPLRGLWQNWTRALPRCGVDGSADVHMASDRKILSEYVDVLQRMEVRAASTIIALIREEGQFVRTIKSTSRRGVSPRRRQVVPPGFAPPVQWRRPCSRPRTPNTRPRLRPSTYRP